MSVKAIGREELTALSSAVADTVADPLIQARNQLSAARLKEIATSFQDVLRENELLIWERVHDDSSFLTDTLTTFIMARTEPPAGKSVLTHFLNQRMRQICTDEFGTALGDWAESFRFVPPDVATSGKSLAEQRVTFQLTGGATTYRESGQWGTHGVLLGDSSGRDLFKLDIGFPLEASGETELITLAMKAAGEHGESSERMLSQETVDVRLNSEPVPFGKSRAGGVVTFDHAFSMGRFDPSSVLSVRVCGEMSTVAFLHSARASLLR